MDQVEIQKALADRNFDELKFEFLSDRQLIHLIDQAQQELDNRYSFETLQTLKCPQCGQAEDDFWIGGHFVVTLSQNGAYVPTDTDDKPRWGAENGCRCSSCDHSGQVIDFLSKGD